tara:strand:+ start:216 stop:419 length:204 start_codon:yes stop_codon:yes gene_type:complete
MVSCGDDEYKTEKNKTTIFYLIRHAEKERSNPDNQNINLTLKGLDRANKWVIYFDTIHFSSIYTTPY